MATSGLTLHTSDGVPLEAEWGTPSEVGGAVVLAHPHPEFGGDMHAGLIDALFHALPGRGLATLRFNFRGVGESGGVHDRGVAERLDVLAALEESAGRHPSVPLVACGWSFGAVVALDAAHPHLGAWVAVAPPLPMLEGRVPLAGSDPRPVRVLVPAHDQLCPPAEATLLIAAWTATTLEEVSGADHFLWGHSATVAEHVAALAADLRSAT